MMINHTCLLVILSVVMSSMPLSAQYALRSFRSPTHKTYRSCATCGAMQGSKKIPPRLRSCLYLTTGLGLAYGAYKIHEFVQEACEPCYKKQPRDLACEVLECLCSHSMDSTGTTSRIHDVSTILDTPDIAFKLSTFNVLISLLEKGHLTQDQNVIALIVAHPRFDYFIKRVAGDELKTAIVHHDVEKARLCLATDTIATRLPTDLLYAALYEFSDDPHIRKRIAQVLALAHQNLPEE